MPRALGVPALLPETHKFGGRIDCLGQIRQKVISSWSQIHGLRANVLVPRLERAPRDDVHPDAEEFLKVLEQTDVNKKRRAWLEVHEQIQVAVRAGLSPGDRAECCALAQTHGRRTASRSLRPRT